MSNQTRPLILCADDNTDASELMTKFLDRMGYGVLVAESCAETLAFMKQHQFVLYILDSRLKDGVSTELCRSIKQQDKDAVIMMYSGDAQKAQIEAALEAGANDYVVKPDWDTLLLTVQRLVDEKRSPLM